MRWNEDETRLIFEDQSVSTEGSELGHVPNPGVGGGRRGARSPRLGVRGLVLAILAVGVLVGAGAAVATTHGDAEQDRGNGDATKGPRNVEQGTLTPEPTTAGPAPAAASQPDSSAASPGVPSAPAVPGAPSAPTAPVIVAFESGDAPTCTSELDLPQLTLHWTTQHADSVTLSIDGPGAYATYPVPRGGTQQVGSVTVSFPCYGPHTYLITARGGGKQAQREIQVGGAG